MCKPGAAYEPINTLKPVAENVWIVDGPLIRFSGMPFPTRMTVIRLGNGDLFLHSPTPATDALRAEMEKLGTIRHLVSPNFIHYWWIGEWKRHYPDATAWASPNVKPRAMRNSVSFDCDLADLPPPEWSSEIDQTIVHGSRALTEVVFFHKSSGTLILADLIENFSPKRVQNPILRFIMKLGGVLGPKGETPRDIQLSFLGRKKQARQALARIYEWSPERIILAHGDWYAENAMQELKRAFAWLE